MIRERGNCVCLRLFDWIVRQSFWDNNMGMSSPADFMLDCVFLCLVLPPTAGKTFCRLVRRLHAQVSTQDRSWVIRIIATSHQPGITFTSRSMFSSPLLTSGQEFKFKPYKNCCCYSEPSIVYTTFLSGCLEKQVETQNLLIESIF